MTSAIAPAKSVSLPSGYTEHFYVGSTEGGPAGFSDITDETWSEDLGVEAVVWSTKAISVGRSGSTSGSFTSNANNFATAGAATSGYHVAHAYPAQTSQSGPGCAGCGSASAPGSSLDVPFTTGNGDSVLILVGGQGTGTLVLSGISAAELQNQTYSEAGGGVIASAAVFSASLPAGSHTAHFDSTTTKNNSGTSLGAVAYVLAPGDPPPPRRPTATQVICNYRVATLSDECGVTVGDSGEPPRSTPTGQIALSSDKGVFTLGSNCTLRPVAGSPGVASCVVGGYRPPDGGGFPQMTARYGGDAHHTASSGTTRPITATAALIDQSGRCSLFRRPASATAAGCSPFSLSNGDPPFANDTFEVYDPVGGSDVDATVCGVSSLRKSGLDECEPKGPDCANGLAAVTTHACVPPPVCAILYKKGSLDECGGAGAAFAPPGALCASGIIRKGGLDECSGASAGRVAASRKGKRPATVRRHIRRHRAHRGRVKLRFRLNKRRLRKLERHHKRLLLELYTKIKLPSGRTIRTRSFLTPKIPRRARR